jgi:23S rRNA (uracil1939-C5)-methyltransferase
MDDKIECVVTIESIAAGGEGIGRREGKAVFVGLTAPGDTVRCRIGEDHGSWARAELLEVLEPSPDRAAPACPYYGICGGCELQHISYEAQIAAKTAILKDAFSRIGGFTPPEPEIFPSTPWEYRNRMQFHCIRQFHCIGQFHQISTDSDDQAVAAFGLKARKSDEIIPVRDCPVADPGIRAFLGEQRHFRQKDLSQRREGQITNSKEQRKGREERSANSASISAPLRLRAGEFKGPRREAGRFTVYSRGGLFLREGGVERGSTRLLDRDICLDATVFFQSNADALERLILSVREIAHNADRSRAMADLYCGAGVFAALLGDGFPRIDLMERGENALSLARHNMAAVRLSGATEFFALCDTDWAALRKTGYGFVIADPPRQGLAPALAAWLAGDGPPLLVYVSCNPATLARDSAILRRGGYELAGLALHDFYPQTAHIESVAVFGR